ncbi:MAG TPA: ATP-binding protein [Candidatus Cloacimonadota bacterium]|nr:ATP-binding protein [Candidatus Cloacimonadota bacterium]
MTHKPSLTRLLILGHALVLAVLTVILALNFPPEIILGLLVLELLVIIIFLRVLLKRRNDQISIVAKRVGEGEQSLRFPDPGWEEFDRSGRDLNRMLDRLDSTIGHLAVHREELRLVLSSIEDVLWSQSYEGALEWVNEPFRELFGAYDPLLKQYYWEVIRDPSLLDCIRNSDSADVKQSQDIQLLGHSYILSISRNDSTKRKVFILNNIDAIQEAAQMKKDFIVNLAHELRTPLTAVKGYTEAMQEDPGGEHSRYLRIIQSHTERLIHLISDLEQLIRLESVSELVTRDISLDAFFANLKLILEPELAEKGLYLRIVPESGMSRLVCDPYKFEQVFINLVQNSLRYTESGGVTIRVRAAEETVNIEVSDTGRGIEEQYLPRIFERFYVADPSRNRSQSGTGLGLAIVKHIVLLHHGTISVTSSVGEGTTFRLGIPLQHLEVLTEHDQ